MNPPRFSVVVDTNVWVSGLLTREGTPARLIRHIVQHGQPVFTSNTFAELKQRLWLPKFDRYVSMELRKQLLHDVDGIGQWVEVADAIAKQKFCRDVDDDKFIHAAIAAKATWLITGDKDLLDLAKVVSPLDVEIISPVVALRRMAG